MNEIFAQNIIGKRVFDKQGKAIGRIEEIVAEPSGGDLVIREYHIGAFALLERFSAAEIGRSILRAVGAGSHPTRSIPWEMLDLSEPDRPTLLCEVNALKTAE
ncbi:PRC-barrel domain-containing protein [Oryzifoliimicrobium ureilyticus]|uniref:PRC-barrel domain-containing protein n=1 Tax=Oryzifoliimicrobium ureilyticus TaxID=3113724 RepID=UPI003076280E